MYSNSARFETDSHLNAVVTATLNLGDHEPPEPLEAWSLADFEDLVAGQPS